MTIYAPQTKEAASQKSAMISFHGHTLTLNGDGTLFWQEKNVLIVSDLHLEKGAALSSGAPLPAFDTIDTIERLAARIALDKPQSLICLGDSFHTSERAFLLPPDSLAKLQELGQDTAFIWVTGNHDTNLPDRLPGRITAQEEIAGLRFCHEADLQKDIPTISGHYHPKARVKLRTRALSARCFVQLTNDLIMPAFGSYTGGLNICHEDLSPFISKEAVIHLIHEQKCYSMPFDRTVFFARY